MKRYLKFILIPAILLIYCNLGLAEETLTWQECIKEAAKNHPDLIDCLSLFYLFYNRKHGFCNMGSKSVSLQIPI